MLQRLAIPVVAVVLVVLAAAIAQEGQRESGERGQRDGAGQEQRGERGERGERGNWDPAQMRQRMMDGMKEQLQVSDEEWGVLQPKIEKVMNAQRESRGGMGRRGGPMGWGGRDGERRDENAPEPTELERTSRELRSVLEDQSAPASDVAAKLTAYRDARAKAVANLTAARNELKELLTQRQEAVLVMSGLLE